MKKLMHILLLSCYRATELIEKRFYFKLSAKESLQLRLHKMMCGACSKYEKQSDLIEKGIANQQKKPIPAVDVEVLQNKIMKNIDASNEK
jgi:hypothetical protein